MTLEEKAIKLANFWYDTDFYNFKDNFEGIGDAINQAKHCIMNDLDRTIEIIKQDISEIEDDEFTKQANEIIKIISKEMTNEKAIKVIEIIEKRFITLDEEERQALMMAIKSLKQESALDKAREKILND